MKKILFITCLCLFVTICLNAQTNIFPSSGNVGIGTTNPTNKLVVQGDSSPNLELKNSNYSNGGFILNRTNYGHQWKWWAESNVMYFDFSTDETNYSNKFTIKSNGNVGISNANPQDKFQISNAFVFHDGGHKVLSLLYSPGAVDLDDTKYASEIRYDPTSGSLHLGTSSTVTNAPSARFSITKDGNVGIGTTSPSSKLHVFNSTDQNGFIIENSSSSMSNYGLTVNNTSTTNGYLFRLRSSAVDKMIVTGAGNVGIGTTNPSAKLHVQSGNTGFSWSPIVGTTAIYENNISNRSFVTIIGKSNGQSELWFGDQESQNSGRLRYDHSSETLSLWNGGGEKLTVNLSGNIGIGTTTPDAKLTVKGNIHTNEVKVDLLGAVAPDYVFYKDYDLKSLKAVEDYIASNGHLPNIPSAKDMETEGIMLKEMNLKLLEKIEELTLYTINREKRIETLEKENTTLKTQEERIAQLEEKIKLLLNKK